ncbi:MAG: NAD-dependent epimerase/dehydratase family protein [Sphaerochaetaceae bacterium]|nr:NAD-dependent epimerase/dehydratase family protein [Sphaerochaetaceae bacterium]
MKILVLGGSGNISRAIVKEALKKGHEVTIFNRGYRKVGFEDKVEVLIGDIKNTDGFRKIMSGRAFDVVIDMICYDEEDARFIVDVFKTSAKQLIFTSSSACYAHPFKSMPVVEEAESLRSDNTFPYGFNKANMERYLYSVMDSGLIPITIIRPSLTFGEGCSNMGVLRQNRNIVDRIEKGKPLLLPGDGTAVWSFTFTPDLARAYILSCLNPNTYNKYYHVCSSELLLWKDLYLTFGRILDKEVKLCYLPTDMLYEADPQLFGHFYFEKQFSNYYSTEKFRNDVPEWKIEISLEEGLRHQIEWWENSNYPLSEEKDVLEDKYCAFYEKFKQAIGSL